MKKLLIEIKRSKNKQFYVKYYGKNAEVLTFSETLSSVEDCETNILAMKKIFDKKCLYSGVWVMDYTKNKKGERRKIKVRSDI